MILTVLLLSDPVRADIPWPFSLCSSGAYVVSAVALGANPARNKNDTMKMTGVAKSPLKMRNVDLDVRLNGLHLDTQNITYTESYDQGDKTSFSYINFVPSFAPAGTYGLTFDFKDSNGQSVGCVKFDFKL